MTDTDFFLLAKTIMLDGLSIRRLLAKHVHLCNNESATQRRKQYTAPDAWGHALTNAQAIIKKWFQMRAKLALLDVRPPIRFAGVQDMLQIIVT